MKVILVHPEIPQNTGNIVRTCSVTGCSLTLVKPLGFSISDKYLKRAGLDYWEGVDVDIIDDLEISLSQSSAPYYFFSSHGKRCYTEPLYSQDSILIFGSETKGLSANIQAKYAEKFFLIPMKKNSRCLNLSNAVSIVIYEAWRQQRFLS
jgi:tRNA (cytidine/uridine-2'-O-)-methyltransferase